MWMLPESHRLKANTPYTCHLETWNLLLNWTVWPNTFAAGSNLIPLFGSNVASKRNKSLWEQCSLPCATSSNLFYMYPFYAWGRGKKTPSKSFNIRDFEEAVADVNVISQSNVAHCRWHRTAAYSSAASVRKSPAEADTLMDIGIRDIYNEDHDIFRSSARHFFQQEVQPNILKWVAIPGQPKQQKKKKKKKKEREREKKNCPECWMSLFLWTWETTRKCVVLQMIKLNKLQLCICSNWTFAIVDGNSKATWTERYVTSTMHCASCSAPFARVEERVVF